MCRGSSGSSATCSPERRPVIVAVAVIVIGPVIVAVAVNVNPTVIVIDTVDDDPRTA